MRRLFVLMSMLALAGSGFAFAEKAPAAKALKDRLTQAQVRGVVDAMEEASRNGDARTAASYMSDDCVITTSFPGKDGNKKVSKKDKRQYIADETAAAAKRSGREYETAKPEIVVEASGKTATASYKVRETYTEEGRKVQVVAYEIATVQLRDDGPAVSAIDVDAVAMSIDDRQIF
ncbi:MAG TPA: nuclear transport factor 2 family protein [Dokdonella sp.]